MQFLGFGTGKDGDLSISSNTTDSPVDSSCSGTVDTNSLTATNASFTAGDIILIHQSRGTGVGSWELNQIDSYVAGTITTAFDLANTYIDSGASQAQVLVVKQYSGIVIDSGYTLSAKTWNGNVGGILAYMCSGKCIVTGTISANGIDGTDNTVNAPGGAGRGFRGGAGYTSSGVPNKYGYCGEGTLGTNVQKRTANGSGGGGGYIGATLAGQAAGGGGGHSAPGQNGQWTYGNGQVGLGGGTSGTANLTNMTFGGGGGGGVTDNISGVGGGGGGGGIIFLCGATVTMGASSFVTANGGDGGYGAYGGGGAGAGGSILIKAQTATLETTRITATGGTAGDFGGGQKGGYGATGRIRVEACSVTGSTNPSASEVEGGQDWCGAVAQMLEG